MKMLPASQARKGEMVTTYSEHGGIGIGYLVDGTVYETTGSFYAIDATCSVQPMTRYERDNGNGYNNAVKRLCGHQYRVR